MIAEKQAMAQLLRLEGLPGFPAPKEALGELVKALQQVARNADHGEAIASRWLEANRFAPTPAELYELAAVITAEEAVPRGIERKLEDLVVNGFLYSVWTDRDVAIHRALAAEGKTPYARAYAQQALAGWKIYCERQSDTWEVPAYDPAHYRQPVQEPGKNKPCPVCQESRWEYLGPYRVRRCPRCQVGTPPARKGADRVTAAGVPKQIAAGGGN